MKAFCDNCDRMQPASLQPSVDAKTGEPYQDICCDVCQWVIATIEFEPDKNEVADTSAKKLLLV